MSRLRPISLLLALPLGACAVTSSEYSAIDTCLNGGKAWNYRVSRCQQVAAGQVDLIRVDKSAHLMTVYREGRPIREFRVAIGRGDPGPKRQQETDEFPREAIASPRTIRTAHSICRSASAIQPRSRSLMRQNAA